MPINYLDHPDFHSLETEILSSVEKVLTSLDDPRVEGVEPTSDVVRHPDRSDLVLSRGFEVRLSDGEGHYLVTLRRI